MLRHGIEFSPSVVFFPGHNIQYARLGDVNVANCGLLVETIEHQLIILVERQVLGLLSSFVEKRLKESNGFMISGICSRWKASLGFFEFSVGDFDEYRSTCGYS